MSNMNFNCDVCGREVQGCTFVNGMKFCAKCYQEAFGETEKDRKISDLQSQLVEKDKQLENAQNLKAIEVADELSLKLSKIHNQDKISFCIEQLEKVKWLVEDIDYNTGDEHKINRYDVIKFIDQQIALLKGNDKNEVGEK